MRASSDGSVAASELMITAFKLVMLVAFLEQAIKSVSSMPQRGNVLFPTTHQQSAIKGPPYNNNGIVPILTPPPPYNGNANSNFNNNNFNNNDFSGVQPSEFQSGSAGVSCNRPGGFVMAPDGCNRCFCAQNGQLSTACSRAFCPPGFPSSNHGTFNL